MAMLPEPGPGDLPLEGFTPLMAKLTNLEDRLTQLIYAVSRLDPSSAPLAPRPVLPHEKRRQEMRLGWLRSAVSKLIPGGG